MNWLTEPVDPDPNTKVRNPFTKPTLILVAGLILGLIAGFTVVGVVLAVGFVLWMGFA